MMNFNFKMVMFVLNNVQKIINIIMIDINVHKRVKIKNHMPNKIIIVLLNVNLDIIIMIQQNNSNYCVKIHVMNMNILIKQLEILFYVLNHVYK